MSVGRVPIDPLTIGTVEEAPFEDLIAVRLPPQLTADQEVP